MLKFLRKKALERKTLNSLEPEGVIITRSLTGQSLQEPRKLDHTLTLKSAAI